jgi:hypothetical protein
MITQQSLIALGGKLWERDGKRRVYFSPLAEFIGLEVNRYNTGNVSSATLNGERISNSQATRMLWAVAGKFWWDAADEKFHWKDIDNGYGRQIMLAIISKIEGETLS